MTLKRVATVTCVAALMVFGTWFMLYLSDVKLTKPAQQPAAGLVVENVTVVDVVGMQELPGQTVIISGNHIERVAHAGAIDIPVGYLRVDGSGKFLVPGLWDMHVHLGPSRWRVAQNLPVYIAMGVTGVRDMMSDCNASCMWDELELSKLQALSKEIQHGAVLGPRIWGLSSFLVHGPNESEESNPNVPSFFAPANDHEGRELARYLNERGVDSIKPYNSIPRDAYFGLVDEANLLGLAVAGHVPRAVGLSDAVEAGQRTVEHARALVHSCSLYGAEYRSAYEQVVTGQADESVLGGSEFRLSGFLGSQDPDICAAVVDLMVRKGTWYVPTHVTRKMDAFATDPAYRANPALKYVSAPQVSNDWMPDLEGFSNKSEQMHLLYRRFYQLGLELTGQAHKAGVLLLAGSDANDTYMVPGFSFHDELAELEAAGLTPLEVLRVATLSAAEFVGVSDQYGSIDEGKFADMVLLNANPLTDIRNTATIHSVIFDGVLYDETTVVTMLERAEKKANGFASYLPYFEKYLRE